MTFRNKILLSIYGVVVSLLIITFFIVTIWTRRQVEATFSDELRGNVATLRVLAAQQAGQLIRSCQIIAESPRLRAVAELKDAVTARQLSDELLQTTLGDLFALTDRHGAPLVRILHGTDAAFPLPERPTVRDALALRSGTDVWNLDGTLLQIVTAPLSVGGEVLGSLTLGFTLRQGDIASLQRATGSDIAVVAGGRVVLAAVTDGDPSTIPVTDPAVMAALASDDPAVFELTWRGERCLGTGFRINRGDGGDSVSYMLLKPFERELARIMQPVYGVLGIVAIVFIVVASVLGQVVARGITRPIGALMRGTEELERGNYDVRIDVRGRDELGQLGARFLAMSASLKTTIGQLALVNADLSHRNTELDEALRRLREAQDELVRTERLAATGHLAGQLAHEINNPVHNVRSCLQTALTRLPADSRGRDLIEVAVEEVGRMARLTRQLLDVYRTAVVDIDMEEVDLREVLRDVMASSHEELLRSGITVRDSWTGDPAIVLGSRDKLVQLFLNVIINARDAMPDGGTLTIDCETESTSVITRVQDSGTGIAPEHLDRIFDAFFTTKSSVSGVGLGLSVCYGIVHRHGGSITVTSTPGHGALFTITLPRHLTGKTA